MTYHSTLRRAIGAMMLAAVLTAGGTGLSAHEEPSDAMDAESVQAVPAPRTRWEHRDGHVRWTKGALQALRTHGRILTEIVPKDIAFWCPGYHAQDDTGRRHFWVGFLSALAKYESTYRAKAVGGGKWFGLLQIWPPTARTHDCRARNGEALKNGADNLSCAVRIMAETVARDEVIQGRDEGWLGVSADWAPLRNTAKRREMADWLKKQRYCRAPSEEPESERVGSAQDGH